MSDPKNKQALARVSLPDLSTAVNPLPSKQALASIASMNNDPVIVAARRSPIGRRGGALTAWRPDDLAAAVTSQLLQTAEISGEAVEEVLLGCCMQVGEQGLNIARRVGLQAGLPISTSASTIDYQCGSGLKALQIGAAQIAAGESEVVLAGGVECMTRVPLGANGRTYGSPYGPELLARHEMPPNGVSAELIAKCFGLSRDELDEYSLQSHSRAATAIDEGRFDREILPIPIDHDGEPTSFSRDEGVRRDTSLQRLSALRPAFAEDGVVTAGSASQISDGAAAVLLMSQRRASAAGLQPRAHIRAQVSVGSDPHLALTGPIEATRAVLSRARLRLDEIDVIEINEAFAPVVLAWQRELDADMSRVNVNGGAIALGHPLGCSGTRLVVTALHELERVDGRFALISLCCNGGLGLAVVIERQR